MRLTRWAVFLEQNKIRKLTYLKVIRLIKQDKSIDFIMKEMFLSRHVVNQCIYFESYVRYANFIEHINPVNYWRNEGEMIIPEYRACDLTGEELEILKRL